MVNQIQKKVKMSIKKIRLEKLIRRHQQEADVLRKLFFIRFLYNKHTVDEASDLMGVSLSTGHRMVG